MTVVFVDDQGNIYLPNSVSIPKKYSRVEVDTVPDIDLCIYKNGKFEKKYNSSEIELDRNKISVQETLAARYRAYKSESDPIYLEWQYDKTPESEQVWRDKVAEIKARYPLPDTTPIN